MRAPPLNSASMRVEKRAMQRAAHGIATSFELNAFRRVERCRDGNRFPMHLAGQAAGRYSLLVSLSGGLLQVPVTRLW